MVSQISIPYPVNPSPYLIIQRLRAIAALMVVVFHLGTIEGKYTHGPLWLNGWTEFGRHGVDLFFLISGFVMVYATCKNWGIKKVAWRFLARRVGRIYPIYWQFSLCVLAVMWVRPEWVNVSLSIQPEVLKSLLLWPQPTPPLLAVGWSLVHEMYFYMVFCVMFFIPARFSPLFLSVWALVTLGLYTARMQDSGPTLSILASPYTFEFIAGCVLALVFMKRPRPVHPRPPNRLNAVLEKIGDASYSLYLSHILVLSALGHIWAKLGAPTASAHAVWLGTSIAAAVGVALLNYRWIEKPLHDYVRTRI